MEDNYMRDIKEIAKQTIHGPNIVESMLHQHAAIILRHEKGWDDFESRKKIINSMSFTTKLELVLYASVYNI